MNVSFYGSKSNHCGAPYHHYCNEDIVAWDIHHIITIMWLYGTTNFTKSTDIDTETITASCFTRCWLSSFTTTLSNLFRIFLLPRHNKNTIDYCRPCSRKPNAVITQCERTCTYTNKYLRTHH